MNHLFAIVLLSTLIAANLDPLPATAARVRCRDFTWQEDAQAYMQQNGATYLDGDKDGVACESLPRRGSGSVPSTAPRSTQQHSQLTAQIVSVGDGDTLRAGKQGKVTTIRLACIDAPEMSQAPYGAAAAQRLKQLLPKGQTVTFNPIMVDRYGRSVAEVYVNGRSINLQVVQEGHAVVYPQYLSGCPTLRNQLLQAEQQARSQRLNFWSQPNPVMPWVYRQQKRQ